ncbi:MAG: hypothetical protein K6L80_04210 [Agarilytica sp.]
MISFLKCNALKLRNPKETDKVSGPSFSGAKRHEFFIAGNKLTFRAPHHSPHYNSSGWLTSKKFEVMDEPFRSFASGLFAVDAWESASVYSRAWGFYYSMFGGNAGQLSMYVGINKRKGKYEYCSGSLLHPKTFETTLSLYLTNLFGWKTLMGKASYKAPINWIVNKSFPVPAASYDVAGSNEERVFVFPITDKHFVEVNFSYIGRGKNVRESMRALVDRIIESMSLELSAETQGLIEQVKQGSPGIELTECFAPLKWPVAKEDVEKHEGLERELLS